jgi:DNA-binding MarR family transcriptional regulator
VETDDLRQRLHRFGLARDRLNRGLSRSTGISEGDLYALELLEASGGMTPSELARRLGMSSGAATFLVDRLERAGWVVREPNPDDRRSTLVRLSSKASALGRRELGAYESEIAAALGDLSPRDAAAVARFLERAAEIAERHGDRYAPASPRRTRS